MSCVPLFVVGDPDVYGAVPSLIEAFERLGRPMLGSDLRAVACAALVGGAVGRWSS